MVDKFKGFRDFSFTYQGGGDGVSRSISFFDSPHKVQFSQEFV